MLWASAWTHGGAAALWPWTQWIRALLARASSEERARWIADDAGVLAHIEPRLGAAAEIGSFAIREAVCAFFSRASADQPLVLVLDDVHAADLSTLDLLLHLHSSCGADPICVCLLYTSDAADE